MLCCAHLNGRMMDAHRVWRSMFVSASDIIFRRAVPEELYISMGMWTRFVPLAHCHSHHRACHCIRLHDGDNYSLEARRRPQP